MKNLWIPNIFIYNLKSFRTIDVLSKLAGLWIDAKKRIYYSQATHITFICKLHSTTMLCCKVKAEQSIDQMTKCPFIISWVNISIWVPLYSFQTLQTVSNNFFKSFKIHLQHLPILKTLIISLVSSKEKNF